MEKNPITKENLTEKIKQLQDHLYFLRLKHASEPISNSMDLRKLRRHIAQCKTALRTIKIAK